MLNYISEESNTMEEITYNPLSLQINQFVAVSDRIKARNPLIYVSFTGENVIFTSKVLNIKYTAPLVNLFSMLKPVDLDFIQERFYQIKKQFDAELFTIINKYQKHYSHIPEIDQFCKSLLSCYGVPIQTIYTKWYKFKNEATIPFVKYEVTAKNINVNDINRLNFEVTIKTTYNCTKVNEYTQSYRINVSMFSVMGCTQSKDLTDKITNMLSSSKQLGELDIFDLCYLFGVGAEQNLTKLVQQIQNAIHEVAPDYVKPVETKILEIKCPVIEKINHELETHPQLAPMVAQYIELLKQHLKIEG